MRSEYQKLIWGNIQFFKSNMSPLKAVVGLEEEGVLSKDEARQVLNAAIDNEGQIEALFSLLCEKEGNASYVKLVKVLKKRHQKRIADALTTGVEHLIEEDEDNMMTIKNTEPTTQQRGRPTQKLKADSLVRQLAATAHDKVELLGKLEEKDQEVDRLGKELRNKHDDILWMRAELDKRRQSLDELEEARQKTIRNAEREDTRDVDKIVEDMKIRLKQKDEEISFVIDHIAALTETVNRLALEKEQKSPQVRRKRDRSPLPDIVVFEPNDD